LAAAISAAADQAGAGNWPDYSRFSLRNLEYRLRKLRRWKPEAAVPVGKVEILPACKLSNSKAAISADPFLREMSQIILSGSPDTLFFK
jgi:hypothetical protein